MQDKYQLIVATPTRTLTFSKPQNKRNNYGRAQKTAATNAAIKLFKTNRHRVKSNEECQFNFGDI